MCVRQIKTLSVCALVALSGCRASTPIPDQPGSRSAVPTADSIVRAAIGKLTPGAVLLVSKNGKVVHEAAYGVVQLNDYEGKPLPNTVPVRVSTMFDAASVTKVKSRVGVNAPSFTSRAPAATCEMMVGITARADWRGP